MKKRFCKLSTYNRLLTLKEIRKELAKMGAIVLMPADYEPYEIEVYTMETDTEKVQKLKSQCKNIIVYRWECSEGLSLSFIYEGFYYSISYDGNPFFPATYTKIAIDEQGNYTGARYCYSTEDLNKKSYATSKKLVFSFAYDDFFKICDKETIKECAIYHLEQIKNQIIAGGESATYCDHYHPRNATYNIFKSERGTTYEKRPMTSEEMNA